MPIPIQCPNCGAAYNVTDDLAGQQRRCPACNTVLTVSPPGAAAAPPPPEASGLPPGAPVPLSGTATAAPATPGFVSPGSFGPPGGVPYSLRPSWPDPRADLHIKLAGIFNIIAGSLSALMSLAWLAYLVFFGAIFGHLAKMPGTSPTSTGMPPGFPTDFPMAIFGIIFGVLFVFSAATSALLLIAGIKLLKRRPGARTWAIVAAIVSCCCLWNHCCVWFLCLGSGVYTLIAMLREDVKYTLDPPAA